MNAAADPAAGATPVVDPKGGGPSERLMSLDALRGFDMFWITGGSMVVSALDKWSGGSWLTLLKTQLSHVEWEGFRFYDLIFPLFVFLVGVSIVLSIPKHLARYGRSGTVRRILTRGVLLFALGIFYSGGWGRGWESVRVLGVLNRIALCYTAAALLFVFLRPRALIAAGVGLLVGYWAMMNWVPMRDIRLQDAALAELGQKSGETNVVKLFENTTARTHGQFEPGYNVSNHFDFQHLPGRLYDKYWDPEGLLSTLPAVATCLLGVFAGRWLTESQKAPARRSLGLVLAGVLSVVLGYAWGLQFPIVKKIWTSSFVLVAGGFSLILLGCFYQVIDVWCWRRWCQPFVWIGANALTMYLAASFLNFRRVADRLVGGPIQTSLGIAGPTLVSLVSVFLLFAFAGFLYRRKVFLRL